nr:kinesin-like protein KIF21B [Chrysemys picta bellii]
MALWWQRVNDTIAVVWGSPKDLKGHTLIGDRLLAGSDRTSPVRCPPTLCRVDAPLLAVPCAENGYASTDEEISEFSLASEGSFSQSFTMKGSASQDDFKFKGEPKLSGQMKAVSAEYLGPTLDISTKNITKSLVSLMEIKEDGIGFSIRDSYYKDKVSRTISLPTRGSTFPRQSRGSDTSPLTRRKSYDRGQPAR